MDTMAESEELEEGNVNTLAEIEKSIDSNNTNNNFNDDLHQEKRFRKDD